MPHQLTNLEALVSIVQTVLMARDKWVPDTPATMPLDIQVAVQECAQLLRISDTYRPVLSGLAIDELRRRAGITP